MTRLIRYRHAGLTFDVRDTGPLDGDPVVLLHGWPETSSSWRDVVPHLHAAGLRTYAPDQRGYSPGARPRRRRDYAMALLVADVEALVESIGRPVHLVGHDLGSAISWLLAAKRPDLIRSLTAVSVPHPRAFAVSWLNSRQALASWYMLLFNLPGLPEWAARTGRLDIPWRKGGMTADDVRRVHEEVIDTGAMRGGLMYYRALPFSTSALGNPTVRVPTTLVWSDGDVAITEAPCLATEKYVDAAYEYVVLRGVSHWIPTEAPEALAGHILARIASVW
jgi:pimeloyl-ACP methyl ester carboxylesterase